MAEEGRGTESDAGEEGERDGEEREMADEGRGTESDAGESERDGEERKMVEEGRGTESDAAEEGKREAETAGVEKRSESGNCDDCRPSEEQLPPLDRKTGDHSGRNVNNGALTRRLTVNPNAVARKAKDNGKPKLYKPSTEGEAATLAFGFAETVMTSVRPIGIDLAVGIDEKNNPVWRKGSEPMETAERQTIAAGQLSVFRWQISRTVPW
jgi:hypothetical protein